MPRALACHLRVLGGPHGLLRRSALDARVHARRHRALGRRGDHPSLHLHGRGHGLLDHGRRRRGEARGAEGHARGARRLHRGARGVRVGCVRRRDGVEARGRGARARGPRRGRGDDAPAAYLGAAVHDREDELDGLRHALRRDEPLHLLHGVHLRGHPHALRRAPRGGTVFAHRSRCRELGVRGPDGARRARLRPHHDAKGRGHGLASSARTRRHQARGSGCEEPVSRRQVHLLHLHAAARAHPLCAPVAHAAGLHPAGLSEERRRSHGVDRRLDQPSSSSGRRSSPR